MRNWFLWFILIAILFGLAAAFDFLAFVVIAAFVFGALGLLIMAIASFMEGKIGDGVSHLLGAVICGWILSLFF